jgi:uncharacterized protein RhaS with RHS repeats
VLSLTNDGLATYTYDLAGNMTSARDGDSGAVFTYDLLGRMASTTTEAAPGGQPSVTLTYTYDVHGNPLAVHDSLGGTVRRQ